LTSGGKVAAGNGASFSHFPLSSPLSFLITISHLFPTASLHFYNMHSIPLTHSFDRDVAAGICILKEAGGLITTANPPANIATDPVEEARLGSRLYLAIR
jgi:hypothetical protein